MNPHDLGHRGEAVAAKYYLQRGYTLLEHNYRTRLGELDLILLKEECLIIAEVKTRSTRQSIMPCEAVNLAKQKRMILAAKRYLQHSPYREFSVRFDVVEVFPADHGWQIHCIQDAFEC